MDFYMGLDVGGTSGRVKFTDRDGNSIGEYLGGGCAFNTEGPEAGMVKYSALLKEALSSCSLEAGDCQGVCVAASGVDSPEQAEQLKGIFVANGFPEDKILAVNDCELLLYLSKGPVLVVISGTGSICYGRDSKGNVVRTGGWNHILSDEGSAYDIGLKTFKAYADELDGRVSCPVLSELVREATGVKTLEQADAYVIEHLLDKSPVGKLAALCAKAADMGDDTAKEILDTCAESIYRLVYDTALKLGLNHLKADLWLWGSVNVKNEYFRNQLCSRINKTMPDLAVKIPHMSALDIAAQAARQR